MGSRQNREARAEYPTGHNKGNDSPDRSVPRANGGNTFGAPMGVPPVVDDTAEREALLNTVPEPGVAREVIESHDEAASVRDRAEQEAGDRRTISAEDNPTGDLTAVGAADKIRKHKLETEETDR